MEKRSRRGQGMTEFIIIVALVAIGSIGILSAYGDRIRQLFGSSSDAIAGDTNASGRKKGGGSTSGATDKNLSNFAGAEEGGGNERFFAK